MAESGTQPPTIGDLNTEREAYGNPRIDSPIIEEDDPSTNEEIEDGNEIPPAEVNFNGNEAGAEILANLKVEDVIGGKFNTIDEAYNFYNRYARAWGFSVRIERKTETKKGEITSRKFVCSCAGRKRKREKELKKSARLHTRFNCGAFMHIRLDRLDSKYVIVDFDVNHTHDPVRPEWVHHTRSHRGLDDATKAKVRYQRDAGIKNADIMNEHVQQAGGYDKVGHTKRDLQNFAYKDREERISEGDAATALAYLKSKLNGDSQFILEPTFDEDMRLHSVFWADSMSIADMSLFGELLAFDTTYKTNIYNMPLVVFSGVNHHRKSCIFGCALLANETEKTYDRVLGILKKAMGNNEPRTIVTDGDKAMRNAIRKVFPTATHRLCSWHISKNIQSRFKNDKEFEPHWKKFVKAYLQPAEFEEKWAELVSHHELQHCQWVSDLYDRRGEWAYTYLRSYFFLGLSTTSRCEGINSHLGRYVADNHNLLEFFIHFDRWIKELRETEIQLDFQANHGVPEMKYPSLSTLEESGTKVFTNKIFRKLQKELDMVAGCIKSHLSIEGSLHNYQVTLFGKQKMFTVKYDVQTKKMECSCDKFAYMGIPCCHMLFLLKEENIPTIPEQLILKRWTKNLKTVEDLQPPLNTNDPQPFSVRYGLLQFSSLRFCNLGANSPENFQFAQKEMATVCQNLDSMQTKTTQTATVEIPEEFRQVLNPAKVPYKGGKIGKKKTKEKRYRRCGNCGEERHYQSTCPKPAGWKHTIPAEANDGNDDSTNNGRISPPQQRRKTRSSTKQTEFQSDDHNAEHNKGVLDGSDDEPQKRPYTTSGTTRERGSCSYKN